jgi:hypothetical protein
MVTVYKKLLFLSEQLEGKANGVEVRRAVRRVCER